MTRIHTIRATALALALVAAGAVATFGGAAAGADKPGAKGKTRPLTTEQLMEGLVKPHTDVLKKGLVEKAPADDEAWRELTLSAALLNESSYTLMDDGRSPDAVWADASTKALRQGSGDLLKALAAKDHGAAKAAFGTLTKSCKGCHDKHKDH